MEVRSTEQCGTAKATTTAAAAATVEAAAVAATTAKSNNNMSMDFKSSSADETRATVNMDLSRTMVNDEIRPPLTRDEKLVAELKSQIPDVENIFKIHRRIGEGTFSTVFLTSLRANEHLPNKKLFALKYLIPTSHPRRIAQELRCLREIGGQDNVVGVDLCLRNKDAIAFVMPYMPHDRFHDYFNNLSVKDLQEYMFNLLIALKRVHEFNVIHRDVKPSNFLHDRKNHKFLLVDFGLAQTLDKEYGDSTKTLKCKESDKSNKNNIINNNNNNNSSNNNKPNEVNTVCDNTNEQQSTTPASQSHETELNCGDAERAELNADQPKQQQPDDGIGCDDGKPNANNNRMAESYKSKRKLSENDETENQCETNLSKRLRTRPADDGGVDSGNNLTQQQQQQLLRGPYIPSSHFKTPLKQMNEISTPKPPYKHRNSTGNAFQSPLSADIKSTILTFSIGAKIGNQKPPHQQRGSNRITSLPRPSPTSNKSPATGTPANKPTIFAKNVITSERSRNIATQTPPPPPPPPERKYNIDNRSSGRNVKCFCYGRPTVCNICLIKKEIQATRAGTPGYRPPEVLLKSTNQTTAVDCWAAGVILISILSGCYPFFKSSDDFNALAEIITVFGDDVVKKTANALGRNVSISHKKRPLHLRKLCLRLRNRHRIQNNTPSSLNDTTTAAATTTTTANTISTNLQQQHCDNCQQQRFTCLCQDSDYNTDFSNDIYPDSVYDLLVKLLAINPYKRISAKDALQHPFFDESH